jgi:hypothetical protein
MVTDKSAISVNAGASSFQLSKSYSEQPSNGLEYFYGVGANFKSNNGISAILDGIKVKPQVDLSAYYGKYFKSTDPSTSDFWYINIKLTNSQFNLLKGDSSNSFDAKQFFGYTASLGYNRLGAISGLSYLFGFCVNVGMINDLNDLKSVDTYTTSEATVNNVYTTLLKDKNSGFSGNYVTSSALRINADGYLFFLKQLALGGYIRSQLSGVNPRTSTGLGIILGQEKAPSNVVGGIFYQFNDLFNQLNKQNDFLKKGGINLVAGYHF